jgi:hypothetical protein
MDVDLLPVRFNVEATQGDAVAFGVAVEVDGPMPGGWRAQLRKRPNVDEYVPFDVTLEEQVVGDDGVTYQNVVVCSLSPEQTVGLSGSFVWDVESTEFGRTVAAGLLVLRAEVSR